MAGPLIGGCRNKQSDYEMYGGTDRLASDEELIRAQVEAWAHAVHNRSLDEVVAHHSPEILMFDVPEPPQLRGLEAYRESWRSFFLWLGETGRFGVRELNVTAGPDVAFCRGIVECVGASSTNELIVRLSIGLQKIDGEWLVLHEHHSVAAHA